MSFDARDPELGGTPARPLHDPAGHSAPEAPAAPRRSGTSVRDDADGRSGSEKSGEKSAHVTSSPRTRDGTLTTLLHRALRAGRVEEAGVRPLPVEARTSTRFFNIFTVWCSMNCNILG